MSDIGKAYVQIVPSAEGIEGSISQLLQGEAQSAGTQGGEEVGSSLITSMCGIIGASVAAVSAAVAGVIASANATAAYGDAIDKTSQKMQISAENYQTLAFAANHCGFETSVLMTAQKKLSNTDFDGDIYDAVNAVMSLSTVEERNAKASELFGDRATQQMQALINGGQTVDEYKEQLKELGGIMSDDAVKASAGYEDSLLDMQTAMQAVKNNAMAEFLPSMSEVMSGVAKVVSGDSSGIGMIIDGITSFGQKMVEGVPGMIEGGIELANGLIEGIQTQLPAFIEGGFQAITEFCVGIVENLPQIIEQGGQLLTAFWDGVNANLPVIVGGAGTLIVEVASALIQNLPQILSVGIQLVGKIGEGMIQGVANIFGSIVSICSQIKTKFTTTNWSQVGSDILNGIGSGIASAVSGLVGKAIQACKSLTDSVKSFFGIASPSKLFKNEVGRWIPEGMALGITQNMGVVDRAMSELERSTIGMVNTDLNINSKVSSRSNDNLATMCDLLRTIANNPTVLELNGREMGRELKRMGVVFG